MKIIKMNQLTEELKALGAEVNYYMSGGGCGTIYFGEPNEEGFYPFAVGPSSYDFATAYAEELCWGVDGEDQEADYYDLESELCEKELARVIFADFNYIKEKK